MVQTWALNPNSITLLVEKKKKDVKKACQSQYIRSVCVCSGGVPGWELELRLPHALARLGSLLPGLQETRLSLAK